MQGDCASKLQLMSTTKGITKDEHTVNGIEVDINDYFDLRLIQSIRR